MMLMICVSAEKKGSSSGTFLWHGGIHMEKKNDRNWSYSKCHAKDAPNAFLECMHTQSAIILSPNEFTAAAL